MDGLTPTPLQAKALAAIKHAYELHASPRDSAVMRVAIADLDRALPEGMTLMERTGGVTVSAGGESQTIFYQMPASYHSEADDNGGTHLAQDAPLPFADRLWAAISDACQTNGLASPKQMMGGFGL